jgi:hypothetical protein
MATIRPGHGAVHRFGDARRDLRALGRKDRSSARGAEDADQAEDRPHQAEQRSEAGHHLEKNQPALQPHDFAPRVGLDRLGVFVLGPARVHEAGPDQPRKGGVFVDRKLLDQRRFAAVTELVDRPGEGGLDHGVGPQREDALKNDGDGNDAAEHQRNHDIPRKNERISPGT